MFMFFSVFFSTLGNSLAFVYVICHVKIIIITKDEAVRVAVGMRLGLDLCIPTDASAGPT